MTNPQQICNLLLTRSTTWLNTLKGSGSNSASDSDDLVELSEDGWQDEAANVFAAKAADGSLTQGELAGFLEADAFVRDTVAAQKLSRRSRTDYLLQANRQRAAASADNGHLRQQWYQIGVKSDAPTEEEVINS